MIMRKILSSGVFVRSHLFTTFCYAHPVKSAWIEIFAGGINLNIQAGSQCEHPKSRSCVTLAIRAQLQRAIKQP